MKRKLNQLLIASALFAPTGAFALGLGQIQINSALNQPLNAQINLTATGGYEFEQLSARLASAKAFAQSGLDRPSFLSDLQFSIQPRPDGGATILITSTRPIREPIVNFLMELDWPQGRLVREFAMFLDPSPTVIAPPKQAVAALPPVPSTPRTAATAPPPAAPKPARPAPPKRPPPAPLQTNVPLGSETYTVPRGDTLWAIAQRVRPHPAVSTQRMMESLFLANPGAFSKSSMDNLLAGAVLRIPSIQEIDPSINPAEAVARAPTPPPTASSQPAVSPEPEPQVRLLPTESETATPAATATTPTTAPLQSNLAIQMDQGRLKLKVADLNDLRSRVSSLAQVDNAALSTLQQGEQAPVESPPGEPAQSGEQTPVETPPGEQAQSGEQAPAETPPPSEPVVPPPSATESPAGEVTSTAPLSESTPPSSLEPVPPPSAFQEVTPPTLETPPSATSTSEIAEATPPVSEDTAQPGESTSEPPPSGTESSAPPVAEATPPEPAPQAEPPAAGPTTQAQTAVTPVSQPAPEKSATGLERLLNHPLLRNPVIWALGGFLAILIIALLIMMRRRPKDEEGEAQALFPTEEDKPSQTPKRPGAMPEADQSATRPPVLAAGQVMEDLTRPMPLQTPRTTGPRTIPNPLERVELLMSVGNYAEAENTVRVAMREDPGNPILSGKLLDIFFATKNKDAFVREAQALHDKFPDKAGPLWTRISRMGRELAPDHPLFSGASEDVPATRAIELQKNEPISKRPQGGDGDLGGLEFDVPERSSLVDDTRPSLKAPADSLDGLDWQLPDIEPPTGKTATPAVGGRLPGKAAVEKFNLKDDFETQLKNVDFDFEPVTQIAPEDQEPGTGLPNTSLPNTEFPNTGLPNTGLPNTSLPNTEFPNTGLPNTGLPNTGIPDMDLPNLDFALGDITPSQGKTEGPISAMSGATEDYVETKLDLATAYLEMGDAIGARTLLEEVLQEGSDTQRARAEEFMTRLPNT
ncbi:MAG: hypothetical protein H6969_10130 [Gammaproteobacteria bacterium]|nr:hypothetical protein [Gammaproteobacteria bacterium]